MSDPRRVVVVGLDGASFDLIDRWLDEGALPNLQRLIDTGVSGTLESCIPSVTFPAWKCYSTGTNPGRLGVFNFVDVDFENRRIKTNNSTSFDGAEVWDYLEQNGHRSGVINMPTTYPPKELDGFMVTGNMSPESGFTHPPELEAEIREKYGYEVMPEFFITKDPADVEAGLDIVSSRFDLARAAIEDGEIDFLHMTIFFTDTIQHFLWDSPEVKRAWEHIDEEIGRLEAALPDGWNLVIMSDHGLLKRDARFYLNAWLEEQGLLRFSNRPDLGDVLAVLDGIGVSFDRMYRALDWLGAIGILRRVLPREFQIRLAHMLPDDEGGGRKLEGIESKLDWEASEVIPNGQLIHVHSAVDDDRRREIVADLKERLESLTGPDGVRVCRDVYTREEIYDGPYLKDAPELTIVPSRGYEVSDVMSDTVFDTDEGLWKADHTQTGLFIANGPDFAEGQERTASLYDLAPTILHMYGLPVTDRMDGAVLSELFAPDSELASRPIGVHLETERSILAELVEKGAI